MRRTATHILAAVLMVLLAAGILTTANAAPNPTSLTLNRDSLTINLANTKTATLSVKVGPSGASAQVGWYSSDKSVVTVTSTGQLTALKTGTATITCRSKVNTALSASAEIKVVDTRVPESLSLNKSSVTIDLAKGKTASLKVYVSPTGTRSDVKWSTSNKSVATVDAAGKITALKTGSATVTCTSKYNGSLQATCSVSVVNSLAPSSVKISEESLSLYRYATHKLTVETVPSSASAKLKWKTSDSRVATISDKGVVTAVGKGTCTITCSSQIDGSVRDTVVVQVTNQASPQSVKLNPDDTAMYVGDQLTLEPVVEPAGACQFFTFTTSNGSVASVSKGGVVTAKKAGAVTITAISRQTSKVQASRKILVVPVNSPLYVKVEESQVTVNPGKTYTLSTTVLPASANKSVKYKSSNANIASVSGAGVVTGKAVGTATITAYSAVNNKVVDTVKVKVVNLPAPTSILLSAAKSTIEKGESVQLVATPVPVTADAQFTYSVNNKNRASVSASGLVTAKAGGYVSVKVTSKLNKKIYAEIKLFINDTKVPTAIDIEGTSAVMDTSEYRNLKVTVTPESAAANVKWTSSNASVVGVSASGKLYARKAGTATVYCVSTYDNSVKDSFKVQVVNRSAPSSISVSAGEGYVMVGKTLHLTTSVTPSTASTLFTFTSSNTSVATVTGSGQVTGVKAGTVTITVASKKKASVKKSVTVKVYESNGGADILLSSSGATLGIDDTMTLTAQVFPLTSSQSVTWKSSNTNVVTVSSTGKVKGVGVGTATVTCTSVVGNATASATFVVMSTTLATAIPARTTEIAGISNNMAMIEAIRRSAANELLALQTARTITNTEYNDRLMVVNQAFEMQAFPWMTPQIQEYWTTAYAYKRYMPGRVYYGLPYIQCGKQGNYTNRQYNVKKAVAQGYYTSSGSGYYLMSSKRLNGMYVGNDCSAFVSMSQWGTSNSYSYLNTTGIANCPAYKTIYKWNDMRAGDLLVDSGHHTFLFLYYVDSARTKMMCIEQGGDGNTIICSIKDVSKYKSSSYRIRRKTTYK